MYRTERAEPAEPGDDGGTAVLQPSALPSAPALVLIVDDNPENLTVIGELLQPHYAVRAANSGLRALALAAMAPPPDLILLDLMMPGMDGFEVLRRLRAQASTAQIPVILLTALDDADSEARAFRLGADDYLNKPIRAPRLLARVRTHVALRRALAEVAAGRSLGDTV